MADRHLHFTGTAPGRFLARRPGLPQLAPLRRRTPGTPSLDGPLLQLTAGGSAHSGTLGPVLATAGPEVTGRAGRPAAVVPDATGITTPAGLAETTACFAQPASGAADGQVVRVCGQSLLGA